MFSIALQLEILFCIKLAIFSKILLVTTVQRIPLTSSKNHLSCINNLATFYKHQYIRCISSNELKILNQANEFSNCTNSLEEFTKKGVTIGIKFARSKTLKIVTTPNAPFSSKIVYKNGTERFFGAIFEFLHVIAKKYEFRYKVFASRDGTFGTLTKQGTWNGIIGHIIRKEADLGLAGVAIGFHRAKAVDFTKGFHQETALILIPAPNENRQKLTILIRPFSSKVWMFLGLTILIFIPIVYYLHIFHYVIRKQWSWNRKKSGHLTGLILYATKSLVLQSVESPTRETMKLLIAIWWISSLILANCYLAFIVSLLSVPKFDIPINSLEDLASQSKIKWTFRFGSFFHFLFKSDSSVGIYKVIGDGVTEEDMVTTDENGVYKALKENYAFIKDKSYLEVALDKDFELTKQCRITRTKKEFVTTELGFALPKKSPLLQLLNYEISITLATGLMQKWKTKHWPKKLFCSDFAQYFISTNKGPKQLDLKHIQSSLALWVLGIALGTLAFIFEILIGFMIKLFAKELQNLLLFASFNK